ncbi:MAG: hypothetical protein ACTSRU_14535 [Candidatus Hodarchaeales archaeon]
MQEDLQPAIPIELESIEDLVRQIIANLSPEKQPSLYLFMKDGQKYLGTLFSVQDYFQYRGLPVFSYVSMNSSPYTGEDFLRFDTRKERGKNLSFVNSIEERDLSTGYIQYIPVVKVKGAFPFFRLI